MKPQVPSTTGRILVVDDEEDIRDLLRMGLAKRGHSVTSASTQDEAMQQLTQGQFDAVVLDLRLGEEDGLAVCEKIVEQHPEMPVVVLTGYGSMETVVAAMRAGAYDFSTKPVDLEALSIALRRAVGHSVLTSEVHRLRAEVQQLASGEENKTIVGESKALKNMLSIVSRVADSDAPVLISGESGTGKELVARTLHQRSQRSDEPFVAINCAALPGNLLESELFGHVRGAFTDAKTSRRGLFLEAGEGTIFLDEIGEMPMELQPKLLRALQERRIRPVGGTEEFEFNARIVTATNRDLQAEIDAGRFREDLYYRVNVIHVTVPTLASRGNDVLLLAQYMLERIAERSHKPVVGLTPEAAAKLLDYDWPGNVRELQNAMERAVALAQYDKLTVADLPDRVREHRGDKLMLADSTEHMLTMGQVERRYIEHVLKATGGNKARAAQILGLDRRTLYRKLERFENNDAAKA